MDRSEQRWSKVHPWQNSWGFTTRSIGALIMTHGDENGLVLPPKIAPIQIIIVPIPGHQQAILKSIELYEKLKNNYRVKLDNVDGETAGFKFNKWELKGVPLRLEIGDDDASKDLVTIYRRDTGAKEKIGLLNLEKYLFSTLAGIQNSLFAKHKKFTNDNTFLVDSYDEFKKL